MALIVTIRSEYTPVAPISCHCCGLLDTPEVTLRPAGMPTTSGISTTALVQRISHTTPSTARCLRIAAFAARLAQTHVHCPLMSAVAPHAHAFGMRHLIHRRPHGPRLGRCMYMAVSLGSMPRYSSSRCHQQYRCCCRESRRHFCVRLPLPSSAEDRCRAELTTQS